MRIGLIAAVFFSTVSLAAQSPDDQMWLNFIESNPGKPRLPEDEVMGLLADRRSPDVSWAGALAMCDDVFAAIAAGDVPGDTFLPAMKIPLTRDFSSLLDSGPVSVFVRYGKPSRQGARVTIPVRASADGRVSYGRVYAVFREGEWLIEQWALDLTELLESEKS